MSQLLTGHSRSVRLFVAAAVACASVNCGREDTSSNKGSSSPRGGELLVSVHTEPRNFGRFEPRETTTDVVGVLTQAGLIRINRVTDEVEPWLADSWTRSADGRDYT